MECGCVLHIHGVLKSENRKWKKYVFDEMGLRELSQTDLNNAMLS